MPYLVHRYLEIELQFDIDVPKYLVISEVDTTVYSPRFILSAIDKIERDRYILAPSSEIITNLATSDQLSCEMAAIGTTDKSYIFKYYQ